MSDSTETTAIGEGDPQDFHRPFDPSNIPVDKMQHWPYYPYVSAHWDDYVLTSCAVIKPADQPAVLIEDNSFDLNGEYKEGESYLQNLIGSHTKGFAILKDDRLLAEFYNHGFRLGQRNLLQSASKTYVGVTVHKLVDAGLMALDAKVADYIPELEGVTIGEATVQQALDMTSGVEALDDYHTEGSNGQVWELEIGLQKGKSKGHLNGIKAAVKSAEPGTAWQYTDQNTDALAIATERVTGKKFAEQLQELANEIGAQHSSSVSLTTDGTTAPCYGISVSLRDYGLLHRWIAQGKAPKSFYVSAKDEAKDLMAKAFLGEAFADFGFKTIYGSKGYFLVDDNILFSFGSFGQLGFSDLETGVAVVNLQDWSHNVEINKLVDTLARSVQIIKALRKA